MHSIIECIYEENVVAASAAGQAEQTELPIYGSGRIGLYRPNVYLSNYMYELSDHLGNVMAVIGEGITVEYLATMESERAGTEQEYFESTTSIPTADYINHTPSTVTVDGKAMPLTILMKWQGSTMPRTIHKKLLGAPLVCLFIPTMSSIPKYL